MTEIEPWVHDLKPGDKVIVHSNRGLDKIEVVSRVTANFIIVDSYKYNKKTLYRVGSDIWNSYSLSQWTKKKELEIKKINRRMELRYAIKNTDLSKLSLAQLEQIAMIIKGE